MRKVVINKKGATKSTADHQNTVDVPLFKLAELAPKDRQVNVKKLKLFLEKHGQFPSNYRSMIWRFLLRLPENSAAYADLVRRGTHAAYQNLYRQYPLSSKRLFRRLQNVCSQLANWSPIFGEVPYLPQFVFPFILVFGNDELAALETSMTLLMWWGYSWHVTFPHPPVHLTKAIENVLKLFDENLHSHLDHIGASVGLMGWCMVCSLFTEVLSREDWLKLMDYLFANITRAEMIVLAPVAIFRLLRSSLLSAGEPSHVRSYCRLQQGVRIDELIRSIDFMLQSTPPKYLVSCTGSSSNSLRRSKNVLAHGRKGTGVEGDMYDEADLEKDLENDELAGAMDSMSRSVGKATFPLPMGRYPAYDGHPTFLVDWELKKRDKALALQQEIESRQEVLQKLQSRISEMENEHAQWMIRHQAASEAENRHRKALMQMERTHMSELQQIEQAISKQRIEALSSLEHVAVEEMTFMDTVSKESRVLLEEGESHLQEKIELTANIQKHRELAESAEQLAHEKLRQLRLGRMRMEWAKGLTATLRAKEEELEGRNSVVQSEWNRQDDLLRLQRIQREESSQRFLEEQELKLLRTEAANRLKRLQIAREAKLLDLERARAVRLAREQADEALESAARSQSLLQQQLESTESPGLLHGQAIKEAQEQLQRSVEAVRRESERLVELGKVVDLKQRDMVNTATEEAVAQELEKEELKQLREVRGIEAELNSKLQTLQNIAGQLTGKTSSKSAGAAAAVEPSSHREPSPKIAVGSPAEMSSGSSVSSDSRTSNYVPIESAIRRASDTLQNDNSAGRPATTGSDSSDSVELVERGSSQRRRKGKTTSHSFSTTARTSSSSRKHEDQLWDAMTHEFDEFVRQGGIGRGPRPSKRSVRSSPSVEGDSALWAFESDDLDF